MFCSSLRKRPQWATVPSTLLALKQPKWQEKSLGTHDLAIPLPCFKQDDQNNFFRVLLLSQCDIQPSTTIPSTMARIERLHHQTGGRLVGILFLLREKVPSGNGAISYMELQASISSTFEMPIMPLCSLASLQTTLVTFQRTLVHTRASTSIPKINPAIALLPYCTLNPPIPEHPLNLLAGICHSLPGLAQDATTAEGQKAIKSLIDEPGSTVAEGIVGFWEQEFMV